MNLNTSNTLANINVSMNKENAQYLNIPYLNAQPDFQRDYTAWDDRSKTMFVETMLLNRVMNPIYTILNPEDNSEEILDGMHRIITATEFLNNKFKLNGKFFCDEKYKKYNKKYCKELLPDDLNQIRNYNFNFVKLDSSYKGDYNKIKIMYEILNRSSRTLNDYEFNKVLYNSFFKLISEYKEPFNLFVQKQDKRGDIIMIIIKCIVLSSDLPPSWSSLNFLVDKFLKKQIGGTVEQINKYLEENTNKLRMKLEMFSKIINRLKDEQFFEKDKKKFRTFFIIYLFIISRLCYKLKNISIFNRYVDVILKDIKIQILDVECEQNNRNGKFQQEIINKIDIIIDNIYDINDETNKRFFKKKDIINKLNEQQNKCNLCDNDLTNIYHEGDHIISWCNGGKTEYSNLQVLCKPCHLKKN